MDENTKQISIYIYVEPEAPRGRRGRDRMVISAYHH
jgi:hypothetical protein